MRHVVVRLVIFADFGRRRARVGKLKSAARALHNGKALVADGAVFHNELVAKLGFAANRANFHPFIYHRFERI